VVVPWLLSSEDEKEGSTLDYDPPDELDVSLPDQEQMLEQEYRSEACPFCQGYQCGIGYSATTARNNKE